MIRKLHGVCDSKGGRLRLHLSEGQCSDFTGADGVRKDLPPVATVMGNERGLMSHSAETLQTSLGD